MHDKESESLDHLVLLVGGNPVPIYLVAMALKPKRVTLFHTKESKPMRDRLAGELRKNEIEVGSDNALQKELTDGQNGEEFCRRCAQIDGAPWLDYTGGTKLMSAHAHRAYRNDGTSIWGGISYLDESAGLLRIEHPEPKKIEIPENELTLKILFDLHDLRDRNKDADNFVAYDPELPDTRQECAQAIWAVMEENHFNASAKLFSFLKNLEKEKFKKALIFTEREKLTQDLKDAIQKLDIEFTSDDKSTRKDACKFVGGTWLELWVAMQARRILPSDDAVHSSVTPHVPTGTIEERFPNFELDVVAIHRNRLHVISCTTDASLETCRHKGFEVMQRAYQLGGDLARPALACFLDEAGSDAVRDDLRDVWTAPSSLEVFGFNELKRWNAGDQRHLENWMESGSRTK